MQSKLYGKLISGHYLRKVDHLLFFKLRQKNIINKGKRIIKKLSANGEHKVLNGALEGLKYPSLDITEATLVPKIVGSYEYQLQPWLKQIIAKNYSDILDVGSAEGYYAVGLAKQMPATTVHCYDINKSDIEFSKQMASVNGVTNLTWNTFCDADTLINFPYRGKTLVICDCEGYELELFTKTVIDKCKRVDFLIELHDVVNPVISGQLLSLFQRTHNFSIVNNQDVDYGVLKGLENLSEEEKAFALFEHRGGLYKNVFMEWAYFTSKESE
ncbi:MAG: class I SAM-dependent methyltransferase [Bacteroidota bacterium]